MDDFVLHYLAHGLFDAIKHRRPDDVRRLLELGVDVEQRVAGRKPLRLALNVICELMRESQHYQRCYLVIQCLLDHGARVSRSWYEDVCQIRNWYHRRRVMEMFCKGTDWWNHRSSLQQPSLPPGTEQLFNRSSLQQPSLPPGISIDQVVTINSGARLGPLFTHKSVDTGSLSCILHHFNVTTGLTCDSFRSKKTAEYGNVVKLLVSGMDSVSNIVLPLFMMYNVSVNEHARRVPFVETTFVLGVFIENTF